MKVRGFIIAGTILIAGGVAAVAVGYGQGGFTYNKYKVEDVVVEEQTYALKDVKDFKVSVNFDDIRIESEERDDIYVKNKSLAGLTYTVIAEDGRFEVVQKGLDWKDKIFVSSLPGSKAYTFAKVPLVIKVPKSVYANYAFTLNAGKLSVDGLTGTSFVSKVNAGAANYSNITATEAEIKLNAGDLDVKNIKVENTLSIKVNAGTADYDNVEAKKMETKINAGTLNIRNAVVESMDFEINAGDAHFNGKIAKRGNFDVDAGSLDINFIDSKENYTVNGSGSGSSIITIDRSAGSAKYTFGN